MIKPYQVLEARWLTAEVLSVLAGALDSEAVVARLFVHHVGPDLDLKRRVVSGRVVMKQALATQTSRLSD